MIPDGMCSAGVGLASGFLRSLKLKLVALLLPSTAPNTAQGSGLVAAVGGSRQMFSALLSTPGVRRQTRHYNMARHANALLFSITGKLFFNYSLLRYIHGVANSWSNSL